MAIFKRFIFILIIVLALKIDAQQFNIQNININDGLPSNIVYDIKQDNIGYLWIATEKGLVKFDGDNFIQINKLKTSCLFIDDENIVYAGSENGLLIKNKSKEKFYKSKKVLKILKHNNDVLIGTIEGTYHILNENLLPFKINSTIDFSNINDIIYHNNSYLIASSSNLSKVHKNIQNNILSELFKGNFTSLEIFQDKIITASNSNLLIIKNDSVIQVIKTLTDISSVKKLKNEIWVTSKTDGIEVFSLPSFSFKKKINKYNSIQTNTINSVCKANNQSIFIGSNKGIYVLKNNNLEIKTKVKPNVHFENFQVNHKSIDFILSSKKISLSHIENNIAISFKTIHLSNPKKVKYRYQLNNTLSPWSNNAYVQYPNLNAGKYVFRVQSKVGDLISTSKSLSFTIDAPFYKEAWFIFTIIISALLIGYLSLHYYIKKINTTNKEKVVKLKLQNRLLTLEQKALQLQMNPHFIFNVLNGIKALGNSGKTKELNSVISKFSVLLRGILNNSRKEEITLQEEIQLLKNYIELEQRMSSKIFTYTINEDLNNIDAEEILIPTMLIQPFIENCIEHAFQTNIEGHIIIDLYVKHRFLYLSITDNGIGFIQSKKRKSKTNHKSLALNVSKERLHIISSKNLFKITEIIEKDIVKGTKVSFRIPLKTDY